MTVANFALPARLEARQPPEARGLPRDGVRLMVGRRGGGLSHHRFTDLPFLLRAGDVVVVNTSATIPAAVPVVGADGVVLHLSTRRPSASGRGGGPWPSTSSTSEAWLVELRGEDGRAPYRGGGPGASYPLPGGGSVTLHAPYSTGRLWDAEVHTGAAGGVLAFLSRHGRAIRYSYVDQFWPLPYYQTVFATQPGSAEMPSAGRPFTNRLVTRLAIAGVPIVPVLLHTGVASPEAHEPPYPEPFTVPAATARMVNHSRADGGRVIAVGTTVVRALESAADDAGAVAAARGWTDLVVTPERDVRVVDGLLTGLHEPRASHLDLVTAVAGPDLLARCYGEAQERGYLWHEFGDGHLVLP